MKIKQYLLVLTLSLIALAAPRAIGQLVPQPSTESGKITQAQLANVLTDINAAPANSTNTISVNIVVSNGTNIMAFVRHN